MTLPTYALTIGPITRADGTLAAGTSYQLIPARGDVIHGDEARTGLAIPTIVSGVLDVAGVAVRNIIAGEWTFRAGGASVPFVMPDRAATLRGEATPHIPPAVSVAPSSIVVVQMLAENRVPAPAVAMRLGWTDGTDIAVMFDRPNPPTGGTAIGDSNQLTEPPFPPSYGAASQNAARLGIWIAGNPTVAQIQSDVDSGPISNWTIFFDDPVDFNVDGTDGTYRLLTFSTGAYNIAWRVLLVGEKVLTTVATTAAFTGDGTTTNPLDIA